MKRLPLFLCAVAGCLAFTSCSDDDDNNSNNVNDDLRGTYELTALTAPSNQDYDSDGDSNNNLVLEGSCYNESWISFHEDGTYDESFTSSTTANGGLSLDCNTQVSSGTYTQSGSTVTTTRTSGEGSLSMTFNFDADSHTLTATNNGGEYSSWNSLTSLYTTLTGNLNLTFTKYSDNDENNGAGQNDDDNEDSSAFGEVVGNFDLSTFLVSTAQDLNGDGNSSTNLATESSCYSDSNITFHSDGTYEEDTATSLLGTGGLSLTCNTETTTGTWVRHGNTIITRHLDGAVNVNTAYELNTETNTITSSNSNGEYAGFSALTNLYSMLTGTVDLSYTKDQ